MNKLLTKIVGVVLGTTMAVGVGVGVAVNSDRANVDSQVNAAGETWASTDDTFVLATSIAAGDQIIIVSSYADNAMGSQGSNNRGVGSIKKAGSSVSNKTAKPNSANSVALITVGTHKVSGTDYFTFGVDGGYLYDASTSSKNYLRTQSTVTDNGYADWNVSIDASGVASITARAAAASKLVLSYNNGNSIFACYGALQSNGGLEIYKKPASTKTLTSVVVSGSMSKTSYTTSDSWDPTGLTVTGTYDDDSHEDVTSLATFTYYNSSDEVVAKPANLGTGTGKTVKVIATVLDIDSEKFTASTNISVTAPSYTNSTNLVEGDYYIKYTTKYVTGVTSGHASLGTISDGMVFHFSLVGNDTWEITNGANYLYIVDDSRGVTLDNTQTSVSINWENQTNQTRYIRGAASRDLAYYASNDELRSYANVNDGTNGIILEDANAEKYTITYNANGGSGDPMPDTIGTSPVVASCLFTAPEGKVFLRWNTESTGEGDDYDPGDVAEKDLDLYAIWTIEVGTNIVMSGGTASTVNTKAASKCGTSGAGGSMTLTLKVANITKFKAYVAGWSGDKTSISVSIGNGTISPTTISPTSDSGISGSSNNFTLSGTESTYSVEFTVSNAPADTVITLSSSSGKNRFVVWGATDLLAETFASTFNSNIVCDSNGASQPTYLNDYSWGGFETFYNGLDDVEKGRLHDAQANTGGSAIEQAMARYDYIVGKYNKKMGLTSYRDFIDRKPAPVGSPAGMLNSVINNSNLSTVIVISSVVVMASIAGYFLLRKRKEQ